MGLSGHVHVMEQEAGGAADDREAEKGSTLRLAIIVIAVSIIPFLGIIFGFRHFIYQPFNIPSESSFPNLVPGDVLFVSKFAYRWGGEPKRGDIAVFKLPSDPSIDYIKRIIGLPGDRIQMVDSVLTINGKAVKLEPANISEVFKSSADMNFFRETLPDGSSYVIADVGETMADNTEEFLVPPGYYFALGDNRDNSQDSRFTQVGFIPRENFVGPVAFLLWNDRGMSTLGRP